MQTVDRIRDACLALNVLQVPASNNVKYADENFDYYGRWHGCLSAIKGRKKPLRKLKKGGKGVEDIRGNMAESNDRAPRGSPTRELQDSAEAGETLESRSVSERGVADISTG